MKNTKTNLLESLVTLAQHNQKIFVIKKFLFTFQESVKKKMSSLNLPTMPRLPSKAKFWKKRSANISEYDPTFRVIYLGNVLTGWAKGNFKIFIGGLH